MKGGNYCFWRPTFPAAQAPCDRIRLVATALTFQQIAEFCGLHILEVQAIADDTAATKLTGRDPLRSGELTQDEIEKGQVDPEYKLQMQKEPDQALRTKGPRYTPVSKRQDKPDGVAWLIRNHPELSDGQIGKLIGTTRTTIQALRERSHWNISNIQPRTRSTLGSHQPARARRAVAKAQEGGHRAGPSATAARRRPQGADRECAPTRGHALEAEAALAAAEGGEAPVDADAEHNAETLFKR